MLVILLLIIVLPRFLGDSYHSFQYQKDQLPEIVNTPELESLINQELAGKEGSYGIYIQSLSDTDIYGLNYKEIFPAASLYKLVLIAVTLQQLEEGKLKLEDEVVGDTNYLKEVLGGVDFGYGESSKITYTVGHILDRIGRVSDNFASIMLTSEVRNRAKQIGKVTDPLADLSRQLGLEGTSFEGIPTTTAQDVAKIFKLADEGHLVSKEVSSNFLKILFSSQINDRIPAKLPEGVKIAHKTGELRDIRHDAGIVYLAFKEPTEASVSAKISNEQSSFTNEGYIIVLLSKGLKFEDDGVEILANISKRVYDYFSSKDN